MLLTETGYKPTTNQRFRVYLTNSLEEHHQDTGTLFANWLSTEANEANHIKRDTPVMCIIGNPPYSGESTNQGDWIMKLMEDYKKEPGGKEKLKEQNSKWINDDYVKFLRYGQHFIGKNGSGVLAYINPHGFLDNPTFRGMRWNLLKTYDKIYTIDLHGNAKKKEISPDGSADINVFDIEQGVSINIFIKTGKKKATELGMCFHYDVYGKRDYKYDFLTKNNFEKIPYTLIPNKSPMYYMVQKDFKKEADYEKGFSVNDLFLSNSIGVVTARDKLTIKETKDEVIATISDFSNIEIEEARKKYSLGKDARDWQVSLAQKDLRESNLSDEKIVTISYRPFDDKWTFYTGKSKGFHCMPRGQVMKHFILGKNLGLVFRRQQPESLDLYVFCSKSIVADGYIRSDNKGGESVAPLYIYPETNGQQIISNTTERTANLKVEIVKQIADVLSLTFTNEKETTENTFAPIDILDYIYAVLHSPTYREKFNEFLKIDFPRVPYPKDKDTFWQLVKLGGEIRQIHLLESSVVENYITQYPIDGNNVVGKTKFQESKVYINDTQYFGNVPQVAWEFYIGGYQPAQKWLKDRKDRKLEFDDILHYQKIIIALSETDRLMKEIDKIEFI